MYRLPFSHSKLSLNVNCGVEVFNLYICQHAIVPHTRVFNCELWCQIALFIFFRFLCVRYINRFPVGGLHICQVRKADYLSRTGR